MGLRDWIRSFLRSGAPAVEDSEAPPHERSEMLLDPELLEDKVNVSRRSEIITTHYEDVSPEQARAIADVLERLMTGYELSQNDAKKEIQSATGLPREKVNTIVWTEQRSIQNLDSISRHREDQIASRITFQWSAPGDGDVFPGCREVENIIENRGGSVPADELQSLLREKAEEYSEQGGTPERMDHWVPHERCRCSVSVTVGSPQQDGVTDGLGD